MENLVLFESVILLDLVLIFFFGSCADKKEKEGVGGG